MGCMLWSAARKKFTLWIKKITFIVASVSDAVGSNSSANNDKRHRKTAQCLPNKLD